MLRCSSHLLNLSLFSVLLTVTLSGCIASNPDFLGDPIINGGSIMSEIERLDEEDMPLEFSR